MPSQKNVPCTCLNCSKVFMARAPEIARGGGKYCCKRCWSQKYNAGRVDPSGVSRRKKSRIRNKVRRDPFDNSVLNPFCWLKNWKRDVGRPKDTTYTSYGHVKIRSFAIPDHIYQAIADMAKLKNVSISQLVSGFCVAGIVRGRHASLLQRAYKYRRPVTVPEKRLDWTKKGIAALERTYNESLIPESDEVEDLVSNLMRDSLELVVDDYNPESSDEA